jgi:glycosyltransferase involved in cell wall biosynthesis
MECVANLFFPGVTGLQSAPIALAATNGPRTVGGLAAYALHLGQALRSSGPVVDAIRFPLYGRPSTSYSAKPEASEVAAADADEIVIGHRAAVEPVIHLVGRAMHRSLTRPVAERLHSWGLGPSLAQHLPSDIGHMHWIGTGWELTGFAVEREARRRHVPFTVLPAIHPGAWGDSEFDMRLYRRAHAVLALSDHERSLLIERGIAPDRVHQVALAPALRPDGDGRRLRQRLGLHDEQIVLFVGRRDAYKGYDLLRQAMVDVWIAHPDARLLVCGPGAADSARTDSRVHDLGSVDEATKADAYAAADIFCLPSNYESFGLAYVEAWSYGVPVIGGDSPAVAELIRQGEDGIVVRPSVETVAAALVSLLGDDGRGAQMGRSGQARQRRSLTWAQVANRHREIFEHAARLHE